MLKWTTVTDAEQVTDEILAAVISVNDGWYINELRVDWDDLIGRVDGMELPDGTKLDLGEDMTSPAIKAIKARVRAYRKL